MPPVLVMIAVQVRKAVLGRRSGKRVSKCLRPPRGKRAICCYFTTTVPFIKGCMEQWYEYVPGVLKVCEND